MHRIILLTLPLVFLFGCSPAPSDGTLQTATVQTAQSQENVATVTSVPPTETAVPTETLGAFEQMLVANQTQNANYELTSVAFGTNIALTPSETPNFTPTATPHENLGFIVSLGKLYGSSGHAFPAFSPDGKMVALISEAVTLWNLDTWDLKFELENPYSHSYCDTRNVSFSEKSRLLAASITCISDSYLGGHLLVWDTENGTLLQDWVRDIADTKNLSEYSKFTFATGFAFLPNSPLIAVANANTIEFWGARQPTPSDKILDLGVEMVATDISISDDGKLLFAFMSYYSDHGFNNIGTKNTLQVWDLGTLELQDEITWPESGYTRVQVRGR